MLHLCCIEKYCWPWILKISVIHVLYIGSKGNVINLSFTSTLLTVVRLIYVLPFSCSDVQLRLITSSVFLFVFTFRNMDQLTVSQFLFNIKVGHLNVINRLDCPQGFFKGAGQQLFNQAGDVIKQKAAEFIKDAIQDVFERKTVEARVLPSIKSLKVVSNKYSYSSNVTPRNSHRRDCRVVNIYNANAQGESRLMFVED